MKRILAIITTLTISWTAFFIVGSEAFASGQLVETKPSQTEIENVSSSSQLVTSKYTSSTLLSKVFDVVLNYVDELKEAAKESERKANFNCYLHRTFYYIAMSENWLNCSSEPFSEDYYKFYFKRVRNAYDDENQCNYDISILEELYPIFVGSVYKFNCTVDVLDYDESLEFQYYKLGFTVGSEYDSYQKFKRFYVSFRGTVSVSFSELPSKLPSEISSNNVPTTFSTQDFVNYINNNTTTLTTSLPTTLVSWKHNPLSGSAYDEKRMNWYFAFMVDGDYFGIKDCKDVYALPFLTIDGVTYYYDTLYRFYFSDDITYMDVSYSGPVYSYFSVLDVTSDEIDTSYFKSNNGDFPAWYNDDYAKMRYSVISPSEYGRFLFFNKENYINNRFNGFSAFGGNSPFSKTSSSLSYISSSDSTKKVSFSDFWNGNTSSGIIAHKELYDYTGKNQPLSVNDVADDFGFLICPKRFEIGMLSSYLDGSRIPQNSYVTISGDSIYDYSITNGDTGDTTNMGDFINNGYAWLNTGSGTQINPGGNGSSGGVGGNVTVGGQIDVGGSVDINVNVNGGNGSGNGTSYDLDTDPINRYLDGALEESGGVRQFLSTFFDFLPPEILTLFDVLISTVIICRILKR